MRERKRDIYAGPDFSNYQPKTQSPIEAEKRPDYVVNEQHKMLEPADSLQRLYLGLALAMSTKKKN